LALNLSSSKILSLEKYHKSKILTTTNEIRHSNQLQRRFNTCVEGIFWNITPRALKPCKPDTKMLSAFFIQKVREERLEKHTFTKRILV